MYEELVLLKFELNQIHFTDISDHNEKSPEPLHYRPKCYYNDCCMKKFT